MAEQPLTLEAREREAAALETKERFVTALKLAQAIAKLKDVEFSTGEVIDLARLMLEVEVANRNAPASTMGSDGRQEFRKKP